ncbi:MAG: ribosome small subunit-dependent GTPase A [Bacteroidales bacterium]|nr:ribosome small subunit-dependent GTPase A [Bacteroidales bacterium]
MRGLVVKNTGSWYQVKTDDGRLIDTKLKGSFRLKDIQSTNPISVGDHVLIEENPEGTALIYEIEDRKNYIIRRSSNLSKQSHIIAANLDQAFLIVTVNYPITTPTFIDRFLATTEAYSVPASIFFNKIDRYNEEDTEYMDALIHLYETIGYTCYKISASKDSDFSFMKDLLRDKITLFSGHSGVGKSTLINRLVPDINQKTQEISEYHNKGMHTTTFSEMIPLTEGGYIIDTPGIKGFGVFDMEGVEISHYFPEIFKFSHNCKFNNCTHRKEPGCAVREALKDHYISESRYKSYLSMLDDKNENKYREPQ